MGNTLQKGAKPATEAPATGEEEDELNEPTVAQEADKDAAASKDEPEIILPSGDAAVPLYANDQECCLADSSATPSENLVVSSIEDLQVLEKAVAGVTDAADTVIFSGNADAGRLTAGTESGEETLGHVFSIANQKLKLNSEADVAEQVALIKKNPRLRVLVLYGNTLGVAAAKSLAEAVTTLEEVEEVNLSDCFTGRLKEEVPLSIEAFATVLKTKTSLRRVDFSDNALGPQGAKAVAVLLREAVTLQELVLNNNGLGPEGGKTIAQSLIECARLNREAGRASALRRVEIGRNRLENGSAVLMSEALEAHGLLEEIALPQNGIRPEGIVALCRGLAGNGGLRRLNLQDNTFTNSGSQAFAECLGHLTALESINIGDCLLGSTGCMDIVEVIAHSCSGTIETLNLQYNEMDEKGVEALTRHISSLRSLKVLMLNGNCFDPVGEAGLGIKEALQREERVEILDAWSDMEFYSDEDAEDDEGEYDAEADSISHPDQTDIVIKEDLATELAGLSIDKN